MISKIFFTLLMIVLIIFVAPLQAQKEEGFTYDSKDKRDPFIPLIIKEARMVTGLEDIQVIDDVALEGIVWDPSGGSLAILNGVIMRKGEKAGSVEMIDIKEKEVTLSINGIEHKVELIKKGDKADAE